MTFEEYLNTTGKEKYPEHIDKIWQTWGILKSYTPQGKITPDPGFIFLSAEHYGLDGEPEHFAFTWNHNDVTFELYLGVDWTYGWFAVNDRALTTRTFDGSEDFTSEFPEECIPWFMNIFNIDWNK